MGYIDKKGLTAQDIVSARKNADVLTLEKSHTVAEAFKLITENNFSQIPITSDNRIVGSITENQVYNALMNNHENKTQPIETIMQEALPFVDITTPIDELGKMFTNERAAVMVKDFRADRELAGE